MISIELKLIKMRLNWFKEGGTVVVNGVVYERPSRGSQHGKPC